MKFIDRTQAGRQLAKRLIFYKNTSAIVLALPRGGVPVGFEISQKLNLPLDVLLVRKIGAPGNPEYGLGAIAEHGVQFIDEERLIAYGITQKILAETIKKEQVKLKKRQRKYRQDRSLPDFKSRIVILVDDGIATGVTVRAALKLLRDRLKPKEIVLATPVCSLNTSIELKQLVDELVCLNIAPYLYAISQFYQKFEQVSDKKVIELLAKSVELE